MKDYTKEDVERIIGDYNRLLAEQGVGVHIEQLGILEEILMNELVGRELKQKAILDDTVDYELMREISKKEVELPFNITSNATKIRKISGTALRVYGYIRSRFRIRKYQKDLRQLGEKERLEKQDEISKEKPTNREVIELYKTCLDELRNSTYSSAEIEQDKFTFSLPDFGPKSFRLLEKYLRAKGLI